MLNVAIVYVGHDVLAQPYLWAAAATCLITIPLSYLAHRRFSFRRPGAVEWREFVRFLAQQLSQFGLGLLQLALFVEVFGLPPALAMAAVAVVMLAYGFITNATWVFRAFGAR